MTERQQNDLDVLYAELQVLADEIRRCPVFDVEGQARSNKLAARFDAKSRTLHQLAGPLEEDYVAVHSGWIGGGFMAPARPTWSICIPATPRQGAHGYPERPLLQLNHDRWHPAAIDDLNAARDLAAALNLGRAHRHGRV